MYEWREALATSYIAREMMVQQHSNHAVIIA